MHINALLLLKLGREKQVFFKCVSNVKILEELSRKQKLTRDKQTA